MGNKPTGYGELSAENGEPRRKRVRGSGDRTGASEEQHSRIDRASEHVREADGRVDSEYGGPRLRDSSTLRTIVDQTRKKLWAATARVAILKNELSELQKELR